MGRTQYELAKYFSSLRRGFSYINDSRTYLKRVQSNENVLKHNGVLIDGHEPKEPAESKQRYHYQRGANSESEEQEQRSHTLVPFKVIS